MWDRINCLIWFDFDLLVAFVRKIFNKIDSSEFYGLLFKSVTDNNDLFGIASYVFVFVPKCPQRVNWCVKLFVQQKLQPQSAKRLLFYFACSGLTIPYR